MHERLTKEVHGDVRLQLEGPLFISIENWRRAQRKIPSRAEAIRQLVEQALGGSGKLNPSQSVEAA
jgi:hypothetical protein